MTAKKKPQQKPKAEPVKAVSLIRKNGHYAMTIYDIEGGKVTRATILDEDIQDIVLGKMETLLVRQANKEPLPEGY